MDNTDIEKQILDYLSTVTTPLKADDIAKALYGPTGTAKMVNPTLYSMKHQRQVFIVSGMGKGVYWKIMGHDDLGPDAETDGYSTGTTKGQYRDAIVDYLRAVGVPSIALDIVKGIIGDGFGKKVINPDLYQLEKDGILTKTDQVKGPPLWSLKANDQVGKPVISIVG